MGKVEASLCSTRGIFAFAWHLLPQVVGVLCLALSPSFVSAASLAIIYTGNTEVEVDYGISSFPARPGCLRTELYRDGALISQYGYGFTTLVDEGLTRGTKYEYKLNAYDRCIVENGQTVERVIETLKHDVTTGEISGTVRRDMAWSGGIWTISSRVTVAGRYLTIQNGAEVVHGLGASQSIELLSGSRVDASGVTLTNVSIVGEASDTTIQVTNSVLKGNTDLRAKRFAVFVNNNLDNFTGELWLTPNGKALDIRGYRAAHVPVNVEWDSASPALSVTFEDNIFKSLWINGAAPTTLRNNTIDGLLQLLHGLAPVSIVNNHLGQLAVQGEAIATNPQKQSIMDFDRLITDNTITPPPPPGSAPLVALNLASSEFHVANNTITCSAGAGLGIMLRPGARENWVIGNQVSECLMGLSLEASITGSSPIAGNLIKGNTLLGYRPVGEANYGLRLTYDVEDNVFQGNSIQGYAFGLWLFTSGTAPSNTIQNNVFFDNIVQDNGWTLAMYSAVQNNAFYNNLFRKRDTGFDDDFFYLIESNDRCKDTLGSPVPCVNTWNKPKTVGANIIGGPFLGGNYWSIYGGNDVDRDGLGDTPFYLYANERDELPLVYDLLVNKTGDVRDANAGDGKCDTDLAMAGLQCTLRAAIQEANLRPGANIISFDIPSSVAPYISPSSPLPILTEGVEINGYSQSTGSVVIDGFAAGSGADGLASSAGNLALKGITLRNFRGHGINSTSPGHVYLDGSNIVTNGGYGVLAQGNIYVNSDPSAIGLAPTQASRSHIRENGLGTVSGGLKSVSGAIYAVNTSVLLNQGVGIDAGGNVRLQDFAVSENTLSGIVGQGVTVPSGTFEIRGNGEYGVLARGYVQIGQASDTVGIQGRSIIGNQLGGISAQGNLVGHHLFVFGNGEASAYEIGHGLHSARHVTVSHAEITSNNGYGILAEGDVILEGTSNDISVNDSGIGASGSIIAADGGLKVMGNSKGKGVFAAQGRVQIGANSASPKSIVFANDGGGVYAEQGTVKLFNLDVEGNGRIDWGAGVFAQGDIDAYDVVASSNRGGGLVSTSGSVRFVGIHNDISTNNSTGVSAERDVLAPEGRLVVFGNAKGVGIVAKTGRIQIGSADLLPGFNKSLVQGNDLGGIYADAGTVQAWNIDIVQNGHGLPSGTPKGGVGVYAKGNVALSQALVQSNNNAGVGSLADIVIDGTANEFVFNDREGLVGVNIVIQQAEVVANHGVGIRAHGNLTMQAGKVCANAGGNMSVYGAKNIDPGVLLCDTDNDGVSDEIEDLAPNLGDGNHDGLKDALQQQVVTLNRPSAPTEPSSTSPMLTIASLDPACTLSQASASSANPEDAGNAFPYGVVGFVSNCAEARVKIFYHGLPDLVQFKPRQHGPVPPAYGAAAWYDSPGGSFGIETINGTPTAVFNLHRVDGSLGDDTGLDGVIAVGQIGPAQRTTPLVCHTLTTNVAPNGAGGITALPSPNCNNGTQYRSGSAVQLTATPSSGFIFNGWQGDATGTANPVGLTVNSDIAVAANFVPLQTTVNIPAAVGVGNIILATETPGCAFFNVSVNSEAQVVNDPNFDYPHGLVQFSINCAAADVTITFPTDMGLNDYLYRKYGPTTPGVPSTAQWYSFDNIDVSGNSITLHLRDGVLGDDTGVDSIIVDMGGPGIRGTQTQNVAIPALESWAIGLLGVLLALLGAYGVSCRSKPYRQPNSYF